MARCRSADTDTLGPKKRTRANRSKPRRMSCTYPLRFEQKRAFKQAVASEVIWRVRSPSDYTKTQHAFAEADLNRLRAAGAMRSRQTMKASGAVHSRLLIHISVAERTSESWMIAPVFLIDSAYSTF
jgi:hypothetical protein